MIVTLTFGNAVAFLLALIGVLFVFNGFRVAFIDEVVEGGILLLIAYGITKIGPVL